MAALVAAAIGILFIESPFWLLRTERILKMIGKRTNRRLATVATSLLVAGGAMGIASAPANATLVPNRYYCNTNSGTPNGGWCYQVNGAHDPSVFNECHWKYSDMSGKPHQLWYQDCDRWAQNVP
jgi:hypothetical protein